MSESARDTTKHETPAEGVFVLPRGRGFSFAQRVLAVRFLAAAVGVYAGYVVVQVAVTLLIGNWPSRLSEREPISGYVFAWFDQLTGAISKISFKDAQPLVCWSVVLVVCVVVLKVDARRINRVVLRSIGS
ncbi:MAG: hypothetical protein IBJ18_08510 [Phycisphaerales bacterium]|nr:hypothetical protein [Phycisphaerales bacterium]